MNAAFLNVRSAVMPNAVSPQDTKDFVRLFALDCLRLRRPRLVCRWSLDADSRLSCLWEPEVAPVLAADRPTAPRLAGL
jgi:hypothetical protein